MSNSSSLDNFKSALELRLNIVDWNPTTIQLQKIVESIRFKTTKEEVLEVVFDIYGHDIDFYLFDGIDNSDINSLLLLATRIRKDGN